MSAHARPLTPLDHLIAAWINRHLPSACSVFRSHYAQLDHAETAYQVHEPILKAFHSYASQNSENWQAITGMEVTQAVEHPGLWKWVMNKVAWHAKEMRRSARRLDEQLEKNARKLEDTPQSLHSGDLDEVIDDTYDTPEWVRAQEQQEAYDQAFRVIAAADRLGVKRRHVRAALTKGLYRLTTEETADRLGMSPDQVKYALKRFRDAINCTFDSDHDSR